MNHDQAVAALTTATGWRKSKRSQAANNCVEITTSLPGWVGVRDSKLGAASPVLAFTTATWQAMLTSVRTGQLDT